MTIDKVHDLEKAVIKILNFDGWQLVWTGEGSSHFDAEGLTPKGEKCIVEMKFRNKSGEIIIDKKNIKMTEEMI